MWCPIVPSGRTLGRPPQGLDLAKHKNAVIKVCDAYTLSKEPYPFPDIWAPLARAFDAWVSIAALGHGLDGRICRRQLRAGGRAVPQD
jgi:hypothetical protein